MPGSTTLRRRLALQVTLLLLGFATVAIAAVFGINRLRNDLSAAVNGYRQLRQVYDVGYFVSEASESLRDTPNDSTRAIALLRLAKRRLQNDAADFPLPPKGVISLEQLQTDIDTALDTLLNDAPPIEFDTKIALGRTLSTLQVSANSIRSEMVHQQQLADAEHKFTVIAIVLVSIILLVLGIWIAIALYRGVVNPLRSLADGVRRFADGEWAYRVRPPPDMEFAGLAENFNNMASQLQLLYLNLEQQVASKSRELVKSERLASVGFLAAGVAHEINNPLAIIAGYAERALWSLEENPAADLPHVRKALQVACDESFRCKQITDRLLTLARPGNQSRMPVSLLAVCRQVIDGLKLLPHVAGRDVKLTAAGDESAYTIRAVEGEMKQVVLNLLLNGIAAVSDRAEQIVHAELSYLKDEIKLTIRDNGRGMDEQTLQHIFEPFFSANETENSPHTGRPGGTGLGLSITHAIVTEHGGTISACSKGPNQGSTFVVLFPALREDH